MNLYDSNNETNHGITFINLETFNLTNTKQLKFAIPTLMPGLPNDKVIENKTKTTNSHILNKNDIANEDFTICNYIIADLPHHIAKECPHNIGKDSRKGQKFIGVFLDGEPLAPKILQRSDYSG